MLIHVAAAALAAGTPAAAPPTVAPPPPVLPYANTLSFTSTGPIGFLTAGELADRCKDVSPAGTSYCFAYIASVHDTMRAYEAWLGQREFCIPARISQSDLRKSFVTYLSAYPSVRSGQAASVVVVALKELYPCPVEPQVSAPAKPSGAARPKN